MRPFGGRMILLMWMLVVPSSAATTDPADVKALQALQEAWCSTSFSWSGDPCYDLWTGIVCDQSNTNVTNVIEIVLPSMGIMGTLSPQIANLKNLRVLVLNNNSIQGPIPEDIGTLPHLHILRLGFNSFSSIPDSLTSLTTLRIMKIDHNEIAGDIPNLHQLANLRILDLGHNRFTASPIPAWFSSLPHLQYLGMENTNLEGVVPAIIFSPTSLTSVFLGYNSLNGTLDLRDAGPNLTQVDLEHNRITTLVIANFPGDLNLQGNPYCEEHANDTACNPKSI